jgi:signal peptidase I
MTVELITRYVKILIGFVLVWGGIWFFNNFGCSRVDGPEMMPTLPAEKNAWIDPKTRHPEDLKRDDIVAYHYEFGGKGGSRKVTARVMGLPGDQVKIVKGEVFVNNTKVGGAADKKSASEDYAEIIVPRNTVFVLCDNRAQKQLDSRTVGPIGSWAIIGKLR